MLILPFFSPWRTSSFSLLVMLPVSKATLTPNLVNKSLKFRKCCSASISVGAIKAPWNPESTALSKAHMATIVLPEPTSPCTSLDIG